MMVKRMPIIKHYSNKHMDCSLEPTYFHDIQINNCIKIINDIPVNKTDWNQNNNILP